MSAEIWKKYPGREVPYMISTMGRVIGPKGFVLKQQRMKKDKGYLSVCLTQPRATTSVHKMVAETFLGPRPEGMEVSHENGNSEDNRLENISYQTRSANNMQKHEHGTILLGSKNPSSILNEAEVVEIKKMLGSRISQRQIGAYFGVSEGAIQKIADGRTWRHVT